MRITTRMLYEKGACLEEIDAFDRLFPKGARVTRANLLKAWDLDLYWAVKKGLLPLDEKEFDCRWESLHAPIYSLYPPWDYDVCKSYFLKIAHLIADLMGLK